MKRTEALRVYLFILHAASSVLSYQLRAHPVRSLLSRSELSAYPYSRIRTSSEHSSTLLMSSSTSSSGSSRSIVNKHDQHDKNEKPQGVFNIVGATSKFFVSGVATAVLYGTNSWVPLYYILGAVLNGVLSKGIKEMVKQPRPNQSHRDGYGMPSSHTQSFFFFFTAVAFNASRFLSMRNSVILSLSILIYSLVASYWRVAAGIHSVSQTFVGAFVGLLFGTFVAKNEMATIGLLQPLTGGTLWVPIQAKLLVSTLGCVVICKSEIKILYNIIRDSFKKRSSYEI